MEEILAVVGFGIGASLGVNLVKAVGRGLRPVAIDVIRAGLAAGDAVGSAAEQVRSSVAESAAEARQQAEQVRNEAEAEVAPRRSRRRDQELHKIEITRE